MQVYFCSILLLLAFYLCRCIFNGEACNVTDQISTVYTDYGFCFNFNQDDTNILSTNKTGALNGLRLKLNIEQYENVAGFSTVAGLKIHLHSQSDIPQIKQLGFALAPGEHTLVPFSFQHSISLEDPWGKCVRKELEFFPGNNYTQHRCEVENQVKSLNTLCGCKDDWMPEYAPYNICDIHQYRSCLRDYRSGIKLGGSDLDEPCPDACDVDVYLSSVSKALISNLGVNKYLSHGEDELKTNHRHASEIRQRVTADLMKFLIESITAISTQRDTLESFLELRLVNERTSISHRVGKAVRELQRMSIDSWQDLMSSVLEYQTSYRRNVRLLYLGFMNGLNKLMADIAVYQYGLNGINDDELKQQNKLERLESQTNQILQLTRNFAPLLDKLKDGIDLSKIEDSDLPTYTVSDRGKRSTCSRVTEEMATFIEGDVLQGLEDLSLAVDKRITEVTSGNYSHSSDYDDDLESSVTTFRNMDMPSKSESLTTFESCYNEYGQLLDEIVEWTTTGMVEVAESPTTKDDIVDIFNIFSLDRQMTDDVLNNYITYNTTKYEMADNIAPSLAVDLPANVQEVLDKARSFVITPLQTYLGNVEEELNKKWNTTFDYYLKLQAYFAKDFSTAKARSLAVWLKPYPNLDLSNVIVYQLKPDEIYTLWPKNTDFVTFMTELKGNAKVNLIIGDYIAALKNVVTAFDGNLKQMQNAYLDAVNNLVNDLTEYKSNIDQKDRFVTNNFVSVDIYYGELKFEKIEQLKAYDTLTFFSDVGGFMGLLLGCSVITVFEVLDLLVYYSTVRCTTRKNRVTQVQPIKNNPDM